MTVSNEINIEKRLADYKKLGYTVFEKLFNEEFIEQAKVKYEQIVDNIMNDGTKPWWLANVVEFAPKLMLPAVANSVILDFAERVMGPFVQIDNITVANFPSMSKELAAGKVSGWHRDRYAQVPRSDSFERPLSINTISYFQDLTDETGPLRVIPGSHRKGITIELEKQQSPHPDEVLLYMNAGDVVVTHNGLLHSGTPNTSGSNRFFYSGFYNLSWLKHKDNFSGPNIVKIIELARKRNDHRILRLFGVDDHLEQRANSGFIIKDEERWAEWSQQDKGAINDEIKLF